MRKALKVGLYVIVALIASVDRARQALVHFAGLRGVPWQSLSREANRACGSARYSACPPTPSRGSQRDAQNAACSAQFLIQRGKWNP